MILPMNKLPSADRAQIIRLLVEGNSMRSASRIADVSINTVTKLLIDAGKICSDYQDQALRNLPCRRLQLDEMRSATPSSGRRRSPRRPQKKRETFGHGLRSTPIPSWYRPGASVIAAARRQLSSSAIFRSGSRIGCGLRAMVTELISKPSKLDSVLTSIVHS